MVKQVGVNLNNERQFYMNKKHAGFSLIEIIIVVTIVAVLTAIALPGFNNSARKGKRSDGQAALMDLAAKMETYFFTNRTYSVDLTDLGYASASAVATDKGHYTLSISTATANCPIISCFKLEATAVGSQVDDGNLSIDSLGRKLPADKW